MCVTLPVLGWGWEEDGGQNMVVPVAMALGQETGKWCQAQGREGVSAAGNRQAPAQLPGQVQTGWWGTSSGAQVTQRKAVAKRGGALPLWGASIDPSQITPRFPSRPEGEGPLRAMFTLCPSTQALKGYMWALGPRDLSGNRI